MGLSDHVNARRLQGNASPRQLMEQFLASSVRGLVETQKALDEHGRESLVGWEQEGIPPAAWMWSDCRLRFPVAFRLLLKTTFMDNTRLSISPRQESRGSLTFTLRYLPTPQTEETTEV